MDYILIVLFTTLSVFAVRRKRDYVLATLLVGQPLLKIMIAPFPKVPNQSVYLVYYFMVGLSVAAVGRRERGIRVGKPLLVFAAECFIFGGLMAATLALSPAKEYGLTKVIDYFTVNVLIVIVTFAVITKASDFRDVMSAVANVSIVVGFVTIASVFLQTNTITAWVTTTQAQDITVMGINLAVNIWFGRRMGLAFLCALFLYSIDRRLLNALRSILLLIFTILSTSHGPVLALIVSMLMIPLVRNTRRHVTSLIGVFTISAGSLTVVAWLGYGSPLLRLMNISDSNTVARMRMYADSLALFLEHPFGIGIGGFSKFGCGALYPHNLFLEISAELGVVGLLWLLTWVVRTSTRYFRMSRRAKETVMSTMSDFAYSVFVFGFVNALFSGCIGSNEYVWLGMALVILVHHLGARDAIASDEHPYLSRSE